MVLLLLLLPLPADPIAGGVDDTAAKPLPLVGETADGDPAGDPALFALPLSFLRVEYS